MIEIKQELLELIYSFSNTLYLPNENQKTIHLDKIHSVIKENFPNLKEAI